MVEQHLGAVHGEGRDDHGPPTRDGPRDDITEVIERERVVMRPVAVRALDDDPVGVTDGLRTQQQRVARTTQVTAEHDGGAAQLQWAIDEPRMWPARGECRDDARRDLSSVAQLQGLEQRQRPGDVGRVVQRQGRLVLRVALLVGVSRLLLLEVGGVGQDDRREGDGAAGGVDGPSNPSAWIRGR